MIDRDLLARIRKCLALSASSNEHEAAAALAKARALMEEHGISDDDLAMADVTEAAARGSRTQRPSRWETYLCLAVRRALGVQCFLDEGLDRRYVGRGPRPEIATYAFTALFRRLKKARADYIRTRLKRCSAARKRVRADAFCEGWAAAVFRKIAALAPKPPLDDGVQRYLAIQYHGLVEVKDRGEASAKAHTSDDHWRGHAAGRSVEIHQGMSGSAPERLAHA